MTVRYKRVAVKPVRMMALHALQINCLTTNPPSCMTRYEWRDVDNIDEDNLAFVQDSFPKKHAGGPYVPVKF